MKPQRTRNRPRKNLEHRALAETAGDAGRAPVHTAATVTRRPHRMGGAARANPIFPRPRGVYAGEGRSLPNYATEPHRRGVL